MSKGAANSLTGAGPSQRRESTARRVVSDRAKKMRSRAAAWLGIYLSIKPTKTKVNTLVLTLANAKTKDFSEFNRGGLVYMLRTPPWMRRQWLGVEIDRNFATHSLPSRLGVQIFSLVWCFRKAQAAVASTKIQVASGSKAIFSARLGACHLLRGAAQPEPTSLDGLGAPGWGVAPLVKAHPETGKFTTEDIEKRLKTFVNKLDLNSLRKFIL